MDPQEVDVTLHHFTSGPEKDKDVTNLSSEELLCAAVRLVLSTTRETRWYQPRRIDPQIFVIGKRCFEFEAEVPRTEASEYHPVLASENQDLEQWITAMVTFDDHVRALADLEEFDHSRLHHLLDSQPLPTTPNQQTSEHQTEEPQSSSTTMVIQQKRFNDEEPQPNKRRRFDENSLRFILDPPHFLPSRPATDDPQFQKSSFSPKMRIVPIHPHTLQSAQSYIADPFARLAWIVPVRGRLQWDGATSAGILADISESGSSPVDQQLPIAPLVSGESSILEVTWTRVALMAFWNVLKGLREAGHLGPLSPSWYAVPAPAAPSMQPYSYVGSHKQATMSTSAALSSIVPAEISAEVPGSPLRMVDHIKLYHDARYTQGVRNILDAWSYKKDDKKIRLLKGARLVLVDERSRGILMC
ncbi:hypothetical protein C8Q80DRAFT_1095787 [Daedaleopsis nitida]|nr:hypothetical protein C8Q80DRAFT_1095787 [Daedaleopsis nitida]